MKRQFDIAELVRPDGVVPVDIETTAGLVREVLRLRKGIQDFLDGNYPHPRSYRAQGPQTKCPHGHYYYEDCNSCDTEHFSRLLGETYTLRQGNQGSA